MLKDVTLSAYALIDLETAYDFLRQPPLEDKPRVVEAINRATTRMESYTRRLLVSRAHVFVLDGTGSAAMYLPQWPVTTLTSARFRSGSPVAWTTIDVTDARTDEAGLVVLVNDSWPSGRLNVEVTATCGYLAGTHPTALYDLGGWCAELTAIYYQEWKAAPGRATMAGPASASKSFPDSDLPERIKAGLAPYARVL